MFSLRAALIRMHLALAPRREICLRCAMPEKFIAKLAQEGVCFFDASCEEGMLCLQLSSADARTVRSLAEKYSIRMVSDRPVGRDIGQMIRNSVPFAAGFLLCAAFLWPLSGRIWRIDVLCHAGGEAADVRAALAETGTVIGGEFPDVDPLARTLEGLCPGFAHISVRRDGVVLLVEAYRETDAPRLYELGAERDLVAKCDAVVEEVTVLAGKAAVQPGDIVRKGQVLIYGTEKETDETVRGVCALGDVTGRVWLYAEARAQTLQQVALRTGNQHVRAGLRLFDWDIPLVRAEDFAQQERVVRRVAVGGMFLPLAIERETLFETQMQTVQADLAAQKAALEACAMAELMSKMPENAQMIDKWSDYSIMEDDRLSLRICVQAKMPIAQARGLSDIP